MASDALLTTPEGKKSLDNALVRRGFDQKKIVYLPADVDPGFGAAKFALENPKRHKQATLGMSVPVGMTWNDFKDDPEHGALTSAMSDWIDNNYQGEDREWMQANAQFVSAATLIPFNPETGEGVPQRRQVVQHESIHNAFSQLRKIFPFDISHTDEELAIRTFEAEEGNQGTRKKAQQFLNDHFDVLEQKGKTVDREKETNRLRGLFDSMNKLAELQEEKEKADE